MGGVVKAVSRSAEHAFSKTDQGSIRLLSGRGVEGEAHLGEKVKHRSRVARDSSQPNLRLVHLIDAELHDELRSAGFVIAAGQMGENVTTLGVDLLRLPTGTLLRLGEEVVIEVTGLRNPCAQLDRFRPRSEEGLLGEVLGGVPLARHAVGEGVGGAHRVALHLPAGTRGAAAPQRLRHRAAVRRLGRRAVDRCQPEHHRSLPQTHRTVRTRTSKGSYSPNLVEVSNQCPSHRAEENPLSASTSSSSSTYPARTRSIEAFVPE